MVLASSSLDQVIQGPAKKTPLSGRIKTYLITFFAAATLALSACKSTPDEKPCSTDADCFSDQICRNSYCDSDTQATPKTTYQFFLQALAANDLEKALSYIDPFTRIEYRNRSKLASHDLRELANQLRNSLQTFSCMDSFPSQNAVECSLQDYPQDYRIQFMKRTENGRTVYKIRNF